MPPKFIKCQQGSAKWLKVREGKITASRIADVLATRKDGKEAADRRNYKMALIAERLTGVAEDNYVSRDMDFGSEMEPRARAAYEMAFDVMVDQVGFVIHPTMDYSGASPDALVGEDGILEIKCPKTTTHLAWKLANVVPQEYVPQMMWEMACCERKWADFVSYDPRIIDPSLQVFCVRLDFDEKLAQLYADEVFKLHEEIERMISQMGATQRAEGFTEKLRKSVEEVDAELGIRDSDLPGWYQEMQSRGKDGGILR